MGLTKEQILIDVQNDDTVKSEIEYAIKNWNNLSEQNESSNEKIKEILLDFVGRVAQKTLDFIEIPIKDRMDRKENYKFSTNIKLTINAIKNPIQRIVPDLFGNEKVVEISLEKLADVTAVFVMSKEEFLIPAKL